MSSSRSIPISAPLSPAFDWCRVLREFAARYGPGEVTHQLSLACWDLSTHPREDAGALLVLSQRLNVAWIEYAAATEDVR